MKPILQFFIILFISLLFQTKVNGQWEDISPQGSYDNVILFDIHFLNDDIGFAVGQDIQSGSGYIFKTTDGGANWTDTSFADAHLRSIDFSTFNTGFAVGYDGPPATTTKIIFTTDQGNSWTLVTDNTYKGMDGIQFITNDVGYMYGYGSTWGNNTGIMKTMDGGNTWNHIADNASTLFSDMHFIDANTGFFAVINTAFLEGNIQKTSDGGGSFSIIYSGDWIMSNFFLNANTGYLIEGLNVTDRKLVKTTDGGSNWNDTYLGEDFLSVYFINESTGYIYGNGGLIKKTTDAGNTWQPETSGTNLTWKKVPATPGSTFSFRVTGELF